jgi:NTE family protein
MDLSQIEYLVFSGGGIRGISYAYALQTFTKLLRFPLENIRGAAGTSAGALYAAGICYGHSVDTLCELAATLHVADLVDISVTSLLQQWGLDSTAKLREWIDHQLGGTNITFAQLYERNQRELHICVTNVNTSEAEYWNHSNQPDMPIAFAVSASMCLPPVWSPVMFNGCAYVDGGITDNFPMHLYPVEHTLAFRVKWAELAPYNIDSFEKFYARLTYTCLSMGEKLKLEQMGEAMQSRIITIDCADTATLQWRVDENTRSVLEQRGRAAVRQYVLENNLRALPLLSAAPNAQVRSPTLSDSVDTTETQAPAQHGGKLRLVNSCQQTQQQEHTL